MRSPEFNTISQKEEQIESFQPSKLSIKKNRPKK